MQAKIKLDTILQNMQHYSKLFRINKHSLKVLVDNLMHDFCEESTNLVPEDVI